MNQIKYSTIVTTKKSFKNFFAIIIITNIVVFTVWCIALIKNDYWNISTTTKVRTFIIYFGNRTKTITSLKTTFGDTPKKTIIPRSVLKTTFPPTARRTHGIVTKNNQKNTFKTTATIIKTTERSVKKNSSGTTTVPGNAIKYVTSKKSLVNSSNVLKECPEVPENLAGRIEVITSPVPQITDLEKEYDWVQQGGHYYPPCHQKQNLALIVPHRNRPQQLPLFLKHMHPFLKKQQRNYTIFIIEQNDTLLFNRGQLMNIGYLEASKLFNPSQFIFHDIDLLPEDDRIIYECLNKTRHLISGLDIWNYQLLYEDLFGGAVCLENGTFQDINGFSNRYWGWGAEDDDLLQRLHKHNQNFVRYPSYIGRYTMIEHTSEWKNPERLKILSNGSEYFERDGLTTVNYTLKSIEVLKLYTNILVELHENKIFRK